MNTTDIKDAIRNRHAVREYYNRTIDAGTAAQLNEEIARCNEEGGLHIQLITDEPRAFGGQMARYGKFNNVKNYIALAGKKDPGFEEKIGYYGERIALKAQILGLNTCWVALTFSKRKAKKHFKLASGEKLVCVLALGYGTSQGLSHKSKTHSELCSVQGDMPPWFKEGMDSAMLAPTAMNRQNFLFTLIRPRTVKAEATGGFYARVNLGIVKYHFEIGAGRENFEWEEENSAGK